MIKALFKKIQSLFKKKIKRQQIELLMLRTLFSVPVIVYPGIILLDLWTPPEYHHHTHRFVYDLIHTGFTLFDLQIRPVYFLRGLAVFCFILLIGRWLEYYILSRFVKKKDKQIAANLSIIIKYISITLGLLASFAVADVNIRALGISLGALCVGIGFGLKNLANDFICGLMILINKPIKIGDHILIENTEGFVKKINAISTRITTLTESTVIIPNSYFVNKAVINYTYKKKLSRISTQIQLENENDIEKAKDIILSVATQNPHIMLLPPNHPVVLCEASNLIFILNLSYVIKNINLKAEISSEINFALLESLRKHHILIKQKK